MNTANITTPHTLQREDTTLHYWLSGPQHRPTIVFSHGATADHHSFDEQVPLFSQHYRVLTWDIRGHGLSQPLGTFSPRQAVADLLAILDTLHINSATFVGVSMGGNLSQEITFLYPQRVDALVSVDCTCNTLPLSTFERFLLGLAPTLMRLYPYKLLKTQSINASSINAHVRAYLNGALEPISKESFVSILSTTALFLHPEKDYHITQPQLMVHGEYDNLGNIKKAMPLWHARDPHSNYVVIPNAGHTSNQDNAAFFNQLLLEFLASVYPEASV